MNIIIVGGGIIGQNLALRLSTQKHNITLIEKDEAVCQQLGETLNATLINGDATQLPILEEANLKKSDFLVTVTGNDETNLLVCMIAKEHKPEIKLASRISNDIYRRIFLKSNIETLISPELSGVEMLEDMIIEPDLFRFMPHHEGKFELLEIAVGNKAKATGKSVKELEKDKTLRVIALKKKDEFNLVTDNTLIEENNTLIVAVNRDKEKQFKKLMK